jgi:hypothetical protein
MEKNKKACRPTVGIERSYRSICRVVLERAELYFFSCRSVTAQEDFADMQNEVAVLLGPSQLGTDKNGLQVSDHANHATDKIGIGR